MAAPISGARGAAPSISTLTAPPPRFAAPSPSGVYQNPLHHLRTYGEELSAALPIDVPDIHQAQINLTKAVV
jgi:hypothetical protein